MPTWNCLPAATAPACTDCQKTLALALGITAISRLSDRLQADNRTRQSGARHLARTPASVNQHIGSGDEAGVGRTQINGQRPDLFRFAPATDGHAGDELRVALGVVHDG